MSKLFKSKFLLGALVVAGLLVFAGGAEAAITKTLRKGMKDAQVLELQQGLNARGFTVSTSGAGSPGSETEYFGSRTDSAVRAYQAANGLTVDGIFGSQSRGAWGTTPSAPSNGSGSSMTYPDGCSSSTGFSVTTGQPCNTGGSMGLPDGCTSTAGFSTTTGQPCNASVPTIPGCEPGFTFSPETGQSCDGSAAPATGPVVASPSLTTPPSTTLVEGQATADLLHVDFTGAGTVTNVVLRKIGVSSDTTPIRVYLFDGARRLTDAASVTSDGLVAFNSASGLFDVNGAMTLAVKSDINTSTSGQTVGFELVSYTTLGGSSMAANIAGNVSSIASASLAGVSAGTITPSGAILNPGPDVTVWQSTLNISERKVNMRRIAFRNIGSAPAASFGVFKLYVNGVQVGTADMIDSNGYVTFDFMADPVALDSGSRVLRLDADILSGASRTVQFSLRNAADVDFVDSSFGVNVTPTSTPWEATASSISGATGGSMTVERDTTSPSQNLVDAASDAVFGVFKVTAYGEPIKVETLSAGYTSSDGAIGSLRNGRLLFSTDGTNWTQYGSTSTVAAAGTSFTTNYTVNPGTPVWVQFRADVYDNDGTNDVSASDTFTAMLVAGSSNAQKLDSLGSIAVPSVAVSANTLTVGTTSISLVEDTTYADQTVVVPQTTFKIGDWNLTGSSIEDILLTTLSFDVDETSGTTLNEDDITNMYAVVKDSNGNIITTTTPLAQVGAADNNFSLNYTLPKNGSVMIELFGNLASGATATDAFKTDLTVSGTSITSGSSVSASDVDGQTMTAGTGSLTVTTDASTPTSTKFADNQTVRSASFKFEAVNSGFKVTDLVLTLGADAATVVQTVKISSSTDSFSAERPGATTVNFNGLDWDIPANQNAVLDVDLVLGTIGYSAGNSGAALLTTLTDATAVSSATGVSAAATESDPAGEAHYAYAAVPSITMQTLPSTVLTNGTKTLAKFTVNTNGTGTVAWKEVMFDIAKTGGAAGDPELSSFAFYDADTSEQITAVITVQNDDDGGDADCDNLDTTCEVLVTIGTKADDNVEKQISGAKSYELRATVGGTLETGDNISVDISENSTYAANAVFTSADNDGTANNVSFTWSDVSAQSHDTGTTDWTNDALMVGLPTNTWTMTK